MLAPASVDHPTVVTLEQGLTAINRTPVEVEVAFRHMWRNRHPAYDVCIDGKPVVAVEDPTGHVYHIASTKFEFDMAGPKYVKMTEYDSVSPEVPEQTWIDVANSIDTVWGKSLVRYKKKPADAEEVTLDMEKYAPPESYSSGDFPKRFIAWSGLLNDIKDWPWYPKNLHESVYSILDKLTQEAQDILKGHGCFNADKLKELKNGSPEEASASLDAIIQFIEKPLKPTWKVGAVPLQGLIDSFNNLESMGLLSLEAEAVG